jgi:hypothetical protein
MLLRAATLVGLCAAGAEGQMAPGKIEATCHFNATTQEVEGGGISSGTMYITYVPGVGATTDVITEGMTPGLHGIHIHDFGDLSNTETGTSTGPHYNPLDEIVRPCCTVRSQRALSSDLLRLIAVSDTDLLYLLWACLVFRSTGATQRPPAKFLARHARWAIWAT